MNDYIPLSVMKPSIDTLCIVSNEKGFMGDVRAIYHSHYDVFVLNDPNYRESITLEVTHWFPYPNPVELKDPK